MAHIENLYRKRADIISELRSDEHYDATETLTYGTHDPLIVSIPNCDTCSSRATLEKIFTPKPRWAITCPSCKKTIQAPQPKTWQAALMWCERNLGSLSYQDLPLFGLSLLPIEDAKARMVGINHNLQLRKRLAGLDRAIAQQAETNQPGKGYMERLEAYLKWSSLALRLIKHAATAKSTQRQQLTGT